MLLRGVLKGVVTVALLGPFFASQAHPLRLSLSQLEYSSDQERLTISLRLFLTDVNEALVFDPNSNDLAFCESNESPDAERLLLDYLTKFFYTEINGERVELDIKSKELSGEGDNTVLSLLFVSSHAAPIVSLEIKNAVFTDLFFDQSNIIYVHVDGKPTSLMLNKTTPVHRLVF